MAGFVRRATEVGPGGPQSRTNIVAIVILVACVAAGALWANTIGSPVPAMVMAALGLVLMQSPKVAQQWERAIVLRLGRFIGLQGPGLFWIIPFAAPATPGTDPPPTTPTFPPAPPPPPPTPPRNAPPGPPWR